MEQVAEKRVSERKISKFDNIFPTVKFDIANEISAINYKAEVLDISDVGMGILTKEPLKIGKTLVFARKQNWKLPHSAVVIWTMKHKEGFRAGIKFSS